MTRRGKIARLPQALREQLNLRLANGEPGNQVIVWLNDLPEVKELLAAEFAGEPVNDMNLTRWRQGGYLDWTAQQETMEVARTMLEEAGELGSDPQNLISDRMGAWLVARCAVAGRQLTRECGPLDWRRFRALCQEVVALRRSDQGAQRLKLAHAGVELARERTAEWKDRLFDHWLDDPEVRETVGQKVLTDEEKEAKMRAIFGIRAREPGEPWPSDPGYLEWVRITRLERSKPAAVQSEPTNPPQDDNIPDDEDKPM